MRPAAQAAALQDVVNARDHLRRARERYHLALVIAESRGVTHDALAEMMDTKPLYITNAIRKHKAGECGCRA